MNIPGDLRYAESHEWVRLSDDGVATVGITDYAQQKMTELVYVELPDVGRRVRASDEVAVVESVKSASDIYAPVSGEIVAVNESLTDSPSTVNSSPFGDGWILRIKLSDPAELDSLMDAQAYQASVS
ncbi:MAG: glycine cleavage system protein GcvH [Planctomycetaceae bacterium]|nr:glycine cleavage system protein GcvH [Planctomycetaceae bacterium]